MVCVNIGEFAIVFHWKMSELTLVHQRDAVTDGGLGFDEHHIAGHDFPYRMCVASRAWTTILWT